MMLNFWMRNDIHTFEVIEMKPECISRGGGGEEEEGEEGEKMKCGEYVIRFRGLVLMICHREGRYSVSVIHKQPTCNPQ